MNNYKDTNLTKKIDMLYYLKQLKEVVIQKNIFNGLYKFKFSNVILRILLIITLSFFSSCKTNKERTFVSTKFGRPVNIILLDQNRVLFRFIDINRTFSGDYKEENGKISFYWDGNNDVTVMPKLGKIQDNKLIIYNIIGRDYGGKDDIYIEELQ